MSERGACGAGTGGGGECHLLPLPLPLPPLPPPITAEATAVAEPNSDRDLRDPRATDPDPCCAKGGTGEGQHKTPPT